MVYRIMSGEMRGVKNDERGHGKRGHDEGDNE